MIPQTLSRALLDTNEYSQRFVHNVSQQGKPQIPVGHNLQSTVLEIQSKTHHTCMQTFKWFDVVCSTLCHSKNNIYLNAAMNP